MRERNMQTKKKTQKYCFLCLSLNKKWRERKKKERGKERCKDQRIETKREREKERKREGKRVMKVGQA